MLWMMFMTGAAFSVSRLLPGAESKDEGLWPVGRDACTSRQHHLTSSWHLNWQCGEEVELQEQNAALEPAAPCDLLHFHHGVIKAIHFLRSLFIEYVLTSFS